MFSNPYLTWEHVVNPDLPPITGAALMGVLSNLSTKQRSVLGLADLG